MSPPLGAGWRGFETTPSLVEEGHSLGRLILNWEALCVVQVASWLWPHIKEVGLPVRNNVVRWVTEGAALRLVPSLAPI